MQTNDTPPLADRVAALEKQVAELQQELVRRRAGDRYRRELEDLWAAHEEYVGAKMDEVETRLTARIDDVENRLTTRIDGVEASLKGEIGKLEKRFDKFDATQDAILALLTKQFGSNGH